jgi:RHS repeat-associated protein
VSECSGASGFLALTLVALVAPVVRADVCCQCNDTQITVPSQVPLRQPVAIGVRISYCRCVGGAHGGPCSQNPQDPGHYNADCQNTGTTVEVVLEGFGRVHAQEVNFPPTEDYTRYGNFGFSFTPEVAGVYTVRALAPCPAGAKQFTAGCTSDCSSVGGGEEGACPECGAIAPPKITLNKSDGIIRTVCPDDCREDEAEGEPVTVTVDAGGDVPDCYELEVTTSDAVKVVTKPAAKASWPGQLNIKLVGRQGRGSATVRVKLYQFDDENECWKVSFAVRTFEAKPDDDCDCQDCPNTARGLGGGAIREVPVLGTIQVADVALAIRAGTGDVLRIPRIVQVHGNGDVEVLLPDRANPVIFRPNGRYLSGWILGVPPGHPAPGDGFIQLSNIPEGRIYRFESTDVGPYPYRLQRVRRFDFTTHSTYVYDVDGVLTEIRAGEVNAPNYFHLTYDELGLLEQITPYVDDQPDDERAVALVYDGEVVIGADGATCEECGGVSRRYYFDAEGLLARITDVDGNDLELFTYDAQGRLTEHRRLDTTDAMTTVERVEYADDNGLTRITHREQVDDALERVFVEYYNEAGRVVEIDRYPELIPHGGEPSGMVLATTYDYVHDLDEATGVEIDGVEATDPAGVGSVTFVKTFPDGLPVFLPFRERMQGWRIPLEAVSTSGMQDGDAVLTPLVEGASGGVHFEVEHAGTYRLRTLLHPAAEQQEGDEVCVRFSLDGGEEEFEAGYARLQAGEEPKDPWLQLYASCEEFGQEGSEHAGWSLARGETYLLRMEFVRLVPSPNPPNGWGMDGAALTLGAGSPADDPQAVFVPSNGPAEYSLTYRVGTDGSTSESQVDFRVFAAEVASYQVVRRVDRRGGEWSFEYNDDGLLSEMLGPGAELLDGGGAPRMRLTFEYDENNRLVRTGKTASDGTQVYRTMQYDAYGRLIAETDNADGPPEQRSTTRYTYTIYGEPATATDACGAVTENTYGSGGRIADQVVYASGGSGDLLKQTTFEYDRSGMLIRQSEAVHEGPFPFDAPDAWADVSYTHDLIGRVLREDRPGPDGTPLTTRYDYDLQEQRTEMVEPNGATTQGTYDGLGRLVEQRRTAQGLDPLVERSTYDDRGYLTRTVSSTGRETTHGYDAFGRQERSTEGGVRATYRAYDLAGEVVREWVEDVAAEAIVQDTVYDLDLLGRTVRTRQRVAPGVDSPGDAVQLAVYDPGALPAATIDKADGNLDLERYEPGDRRTRNQYDALGRAVAAVDPEGTVTQRAYSPCGWIASEVVDPDGLALTTRMQRDALGRVTRRDAPDGSYQTMHYLSLGPIVRRSGFDADDAPNHQERWRFDTGGRLVENVRMFDPTDNGPPVAGRDFIHRVAYHPNATPGAGRTATETLVDGVADRVTRQAYDAFGRLEVIALPLDGDVNFERIEYDPATGRESARVASDPLGARRTEMTYDALDRVVEQRVLGDGKGEDDLVTRQAFDALDRVIRRTTPDGMVTLRAYDLRGRLTTIIDDANGLARTSRFEHDRLGRAVRFVANDGTIEQTTVYAYDAVDRMTLIRFPDHVEGQDPGDVVLTYDAAGRVATITDQGGRTVRRTYDAGSRVTLKQVVGTELRCTFAYDGRGRMTRHEREGVAATVMTYNALDALLTEVQTVDGVTRTVSYEFNPLGERTDMVYPSDIALTTRYSYDPLGNGTRITANDQELARYTYAGAFVTSRTTTTDRGVALGLDYAYDHHRRVTGITNRSPGGVLAEFRMNHDPAGSPTSVDEQSARVPTWDVDYAYDGLQRLIRADYRGAVTGAEAFEYDLSGNRQRYCPRECDPKDPKQGVFYEHNVVNEYTSIREDDQPRPLLHDAAGDLTLDELGYGYSYDFDHRLERVFRDEDADGTWDEGEPVIAEYAYDATGRRVMRRADGETHRYYYAGQNVVAEYVGAAPQAPYRWFVGGVNYIDEHVAVFTNDPRAGGETADFYPLMGPNHSVAGVATDRGQVVERYAYDAYGARTRYRLLGDADFDGDVDRDDYRGFAGCVSGPIGSGTYRRPSDDCRAAHDADGDEDIDLQDFLVLEIAFTGDVEEEGFRPAGPDAYRPAPGGFIEPYAWTGRRLDTLDGGHLELQNQRERVYVPRLGRFLQRDPAGYVDGQNLYEYVSSRPTFFTDPFGLFKSTCIGGEKSLSKLGAKSFLFHKLKWFKEPSVQRFSFGGASLILTYGPKDISIKACTACCKDGPQRGEVVWNGEGGISGIVSLELTGYLGIGGEFNFRFVSGTFFAGIRLWGKASASVSLKVKWDNCNDDWNLELPTKIKVGPEVGGAATIKIEGKIGSWTFKLIDIEGGVKGRLLCDLTFSPIQLGNCKAEAILFAKACFGKEEDRPWWLPCFTFEHTIWESG